MLLPHHQDLIARSGITSEVAQARGYWSATKRGELKDLGFGEAQRRVPALVHPVYGVIGKLVLHQIRPDEPRADKDGRAVKYETPSEARMVVMRGEALKTRSDKENRRQGDRHIQPRRSHWGKNHGRESPCLFSGGAERERAEKP